MALKGGSVGFQIGGQATDFVLLLMNDRGANGILSSKVKLGTDASVAAGPVGRNASAEANVSFTPKTKAYKVRLDAPSLILQNLKTCERKSSN